MYRMLCQRPRRLSAFTMATIFLYHLSSARQAKTPFVVSGGAGSCRYARLLANAGQTGIDRWASHGRDQTQVVVSVEARQARGKLIPEPGDAVAAADDESDALRKRGERRFLG